MADKKYKINFELSDGSTKSVEFTSPQGEKGDTGPQGIQGIQGPAGADGSKGEKGDPGRSIGVFVTDYGAKGDGTTADTTAFLNALAENRVVFVPGGTYKLNGTLVIRENCCLELSQDTILQFEQTSGNCVEMRGSAVLRGNHAMISVPYAFTGNVISMDTTQDGTNHNSIPPYLHAGSHMFKRQRFIYDINILKPDASGICKSTDGNCNGTGIYMHCLGTASFRWMWAITMSGVRIAGGFSYGIRAYNIDKTGDYEDNAWNHDMRIEAVIENCEIGVALENCNGAHLAVTIQPHATESGVKYAKHGVYLNDARYIDMIGSRIWDWNANNTLWTADGQYQHIAMIGNCRGLLLDDFIVHEESGDIRDRIYTDTPVNFDSMTVLQEPGSKWFKSVDSEPYFNDGNSDKRLAMKSDFDEYFVTDRIKKFEDVLATATDKNGEILNGVGYKKGMYFDSSGTEHEGSDYSYYVSTGFMPCVPGDVLHIQNIHFDQALAVGDNSCKIAYFDANRNYVFGQSCTNVMTGSKYFQAGERTEDGLKITMNPALGIEKGDIQYVRFVFHIYDFGENPAISVNEEIEFEQAGFLADRIKVKAKNIDGLNADGSVQPDWNAAEGEPGHILNKPEGVGYIEMEVLYDGELSYSDTVYHAPGFLAEDGETYTITWNGTPYICTAKTIVADGVLAVVLGNVGVFVPEEEQTGEPFAYSWDETSGPLWLWIDENGNEINDANRLPTAKIEHHKIVKIPTKFIDKVPFIDLADFGLPAVEVDGGIVTSQNGVDELRAIMLNGHFKYKVIVKMGGANFPVTISATPTCAELFDMYQAYTLGNFGGNICIILSIQEGMIILSATSLNI